MKTLGSLFAGIGGIDLGFERAGFKTLWQVEINPYCQKVLARHFPDAERFSDVREVGKHNLRPVDVIAGGFPCQDISNAGKRAGIDGERSGLWSEYFRIVSELRPKFVLVENVAALLGRGIERVCGDLATIGYDAEWQVISAADVGAPHLRERVWIVAYADIGNESIGWRSPWESGHAVFSGEVMGNHSIEGLPDWAGGTVGQPRPLTEFERPGGEDVAHTQSDLRGTSGDERPEASDGASARPDVDDTEGNGRNVCESADLGKTEGEINSSSNASAVRGKTKEREIERVVCRMADGVSAAMDGVIPVRNRVDRLRALGNSVVPQIPELIAHRIAELL